MSSLLKNKRRIKNIEQVGDCAVPARFSRMLMSENRDRNSKIKIKSIRCKEAGGFNGKG